MKAPLISRAAGPLLRPACAACARTGGAGMTVDALVAGAHFLDTGAAGLRYWDLHVFLLVPSAWLLTSGAPSLLSRDAAPLTRTASFNYLAFILCIAVAQAFIWDSVGAEIGIWQFNPLKCTGLGARSALPLEEVLWLFHHVVKAALWQLKVHEASWLAADRRPEPMDPRLREAGNYAFAALGVGGAWALQGDVDSLKCLGLVAAFFAPVMGIIYNLGGRYFRSHWKLFLAGWAVPGLWTVGVDCLGQQQDVWWFPPKFLSGIAACDGWLKLDIALVYLVSTFAVTATGAIILAAADELTAQRRAAAEGEGEGVAGEAGVGEHGAEEPGVADLGIFIFDNAFPGSGRKLAEAGRAAADAIEGFWPPQKRAPRRDLPDLG